MAKQSKSKLNYRAAPRQVVIRYPHFFKYKAGTEVFLDEAGKQLDQGNMINRPHQVIAIGKEAAEMLGIKANDYVWINPQVLNAKGGASVYLELEIRGLSFDSGYVVGSAIYAEPWEKADADREIEHIRQRNLEKNMNIGARSRN